MRTTLRCSQRDSPGARVSGVFFYSGAFLYGPRLPGFGALLEFVTVALGLVARRLIDEGYQTQASQT